VPRLAASLALLCILAPFGGIFAVDRGNCCSSMNRGACPLRRASHHACSSPQPACRAHLSENATGALVDFQLRALERPLTESSSASLLVPPAAGPVADRLRIDPQWLTFPPELPPPR